MPTRGPTRRSPCRGRDTSVKEIPMSVSTRLRMPVLAAAAVVITTLGVAVPGSSGAPTSRAHTSSATATTNGYTSHVIGTWGRHGTVRGHFVPLRSFERGGKTYVQGNLTATVRRASGALVGRTHRHDVLLPVRG